LRSRKAEIRGRRILQCRGGGARLTPLGRRVVKHYRAIERKAQRAAATHLSALQAARAGNS
jgi:molybdate transport repressor ModE-like protein